MTDEELVALVSTLVRTSDDRMHNYLQLDDTRVYLEPMSTLTQAKAQWADAHWVVKQLLKLGAKSGLED